jgi:hypothetical protein
MAESQSQTSIKTQVIFSNTDDLTQVSPFYNTDDLTQGSLSNTDDDLTQIIEFNQLESEEEDAEEEDVSEEEEEENDGIDIES